MKYIGDVVDDSYIESMHKYYTFTEMLSGDFETMERLIWLTINTSTA